MKQFLFIIVFCLIFQCVLGNEKIIFDQFKVKVTGTTQITKSLTFPEKLEKFTLSNMDKLEINVKLLEEETKKPVNKIEQAMLYLTNTESSNTYIMESKENGKYGITLKNLSIDNGEYSLLVRFSSPNKDYIPLIYTFGKIEIANKQVEQPVDPNKAPTLMESEGPNFYPKPDQPHIFKPDPKKPNLTLAKIFTVLVLAPWIFLVVMWTKIGVNIKGLFKSKTTFIYGILFLASLLSILLILVFYFIKLNIFQTLGYIGIASIFTAIFGHLVLCNKAENRINERKAKSSSVSTPSTTQTNESKNKSE